MNYLGKVVFLCILLAPITLFSNENDTQKQVSLEFYPKWYSANNITFQGNVGVKKILQQSDWVTYYAKPSTTYALARNWAIHGGVGFYYTDNKTFKNTKEWRPFVGLSHFTNFTDSWGISSYLRTEERLRYTIGSNNQSETTRLRLRFRNSFKLDSAWHSWNKMTLDLEGFKSFTNQETVAPTYEYETRLTFGIEHSLKDNKKVRFELAWKYKTQATQISDTDINTIYFKLQYFPSWGSKFRNRLRDRGIDE